MLTVDLNMEHRTSTSRAAIGQYFLQIIPVLYYCCCIAVNTCYLRCGLPSEFFDHLLALLTNDQQRANVNIVKYKVVQ